MLFISNAYVLLVFGTVEKNAILHIGSSGIFLVDVNLLEEAKSVPQFQMMECGIIALDCNSPVCEGSL
jgi:hypothetical protein